MRIIVEFKFLISGASEQRQANEEWIPVKNVRKTNRGIQSARVLARKISMRDNVYEVLLTVQGSDDPEIQEFYRNGELYDKLW